MTISPSNMKSATYRYLDFIPTQYHEEFLSLVTKRYIKLKSTVPFLETPIRLLMSVHYASESMTAKYQTNIEIAEVMRDVKRVAEQDAKDLLVQKDTQPS